MKIEVRVEHSNGRGFTNTFTNYGQLLAWVQKEFEKVLHYRKNKKAQSG